jgi:hypothetical protein
VPTRSRSGNGARHSQEALVAHAERSGFPANRITEVPQIIDAVTANG